MRSSGETGRGGDLPGLPQMAAVMRGDQSHALREAELQPGDERRRDLDARQAQALGEAGDFDQAVMDANEIVDPSDNAFTIQGCANEDPFP